MLIQRAYRYRFYPTPDQADQLARSFGCARWIYNWGLKERSTAFYNNGQRVYYKDLAARLKGLKQDPETSWLSEVSSVVLQQSLRHLDTAFTKWGIQLNTVMLVFQNGIKHAESPACLAKGWD
ncbi:MAG: helix-turn-helix domain-containing protein [Ferrovum myxofaciens]|uniref:transposase n=1 Tax=Ferrovum myxofaciens TaxID=416213 RepID=UPI001C793ED6|nr:transposase [Ferrovum myxofaciens]QWY75595.1 MAG: helix-turn-helix domain-containing protein [Ferrovum myxofaciens]